ncbi:hypothetical protein B0H16DRAFT_1467338 [Mycena metata]|uniref:Uncharacterized protein n=1 Tax=Mycena metata TaxID=1033252 RepID=A0AAD7I618_9AGAR|nr:hypothetical protein B0H16DRAFT_1467338 [Mycena metata]
MVTVRGGAGNDLDLPPPRGNTTSSVAARIEAERLAEIEDLRIVEEELSQYEAEGILTDRNPEYADFDLVRYWQFIYRNGRIDFTEGLIATEEELSVIDVDPNILEALLAAGKIEELVGLLNESYEGWGASGP